MIRVGRVPDQADQAGRATLILTLRRIKVTTKKSSASTAIAATTPAVTFAPGSANPDGSAWEKRPTAWPWLPERSRPAADAATVERDRPHQHAG